MEEGIHLTELEVGVGVRGELSISKRQNQTKQLQSWCYCYCCECLFVLSLQEDPFGAYGCSLFLEFNHCSNGLFHSPPSLSSFPLFDLSLCNRWVLCAVLGSGVVWFRVDSDGSVLFSLILFFLRCFTFWGCVFFVLEFMRIVWVSVMEVIQVGIFCWWHKGLFFICFFPVWFVGCTCSF